MGTSSALIFLDKWPNSVRALEKELKKVLTPFRSGRSWRKAGSFDFGWHYESFIRLPSTIAIDDDKYTELGVKIYDDVYFDGLDGFSCRKMENLDADARSRLDIDSFIERNGIARFSRNNVLDWDAAQEIVAKESIIFPWGLFYDGDSIQMYEDRSTLDGFGPWKALKKDQRMLASFLVLALKDGCHFEVVFRQI
jgi:hypothetical protein